MFTRCQCSPDSKRGRIAMRRQFRQSARHIAVTPHCGRCGRTEWTQLRAASGARPRTRKMCGGHQSAEKLCHGGVWMVLARLRGLHEDRSTQPVEAMICRRVLGQSRALVRQMVAQLVTRTTISGTQSLSNATVDGVSLPADSVKPHSHPLVRPSWARPCQSGTQRTSQMMQYQTQLPGTPYTPYHSSRNHDPPCKGRPQSGHILYPGMNLQRASRGQGRR